MPSALSDPLYERLRRAFPADQAYRADDWSDPPMPEAVGAFLQQFVRHRARLEMQQLRDARTSWVEYDHPEVEQATRRYDEAVHAHVRIPADRWASVLRHATHTVTAYLVEPVPTLASFVFRDATAALDLESVRWRMRFFEPYRYLHDAVTAYAKQHDLGRIRQDTFEAFLGRIDAHVGADSTAERLLRLLRPLYQVAEAATGRAEVPTPLLCTFFEAKQASDLTDRLRTLEADGHAALTADRLGHVLRTDRPADAPSSEPGGSEPSGDAPGPRDPDAPTTDAPHGPTVADADVEEPADSGDTVPEASESDEAPRPTATPSASAGDGAGKAGPVADDEASPDAPAPPDADAPPLDADEPLAVEPLRAPAEGPTERDAEGDAKQPVASTDDADTSAGRAPMEADPAAETPASEPSAPEPSAPDAAAPPGEAPSTEARDADRTPPSTADEPAAERSEQPADDTPASDQEGPEEPSPGASETPQETRSRTQPPAKLSTETSAARELTDADPADEDDETPAPHDDSSASADRTNPGAQLGASEASPPDESPSEEAPAASTPPASDDGPAPRWKQFQQQQSASSDETRASNDLPRWAQFKPRPEDGGGEASGSESSDSRSSWAGELATLERHVLGTAQPDARQEYVQELFDSSIEDYRDVLQRLHRASTWGEASQIIARDVFRANKVNIYSDTAVQFTDTVEARFRS